MFREYSDPVFMWTTEIFGVFINCIHKLLLFPGIFFVRGTYSRPHQTFRAAEQYFAYVTYIDIWQNVLLIALCSGKYCCRGFILSHFGCGDNEATGMRKKINKIGQSLYSPIYWSMSIKKLSIIICVISTLKWISNDRMDIHSIHDIAVLCTVDPVNRRLWLWWMAEISTDSGGDQAENSYISRYTGWVSRWMDVQGAWWYHSTIVMPIIRYLHILWSYEILLFCFWNNMYRKLLSLWKISTLSTNKHVLLLWCWV